METTFPQEPDLPEEMGVPAENRGEREGRGGEGHGEGQRRSEEVETAEKEMDKMPLTQELENLIGAGLPAVKQQSTVVKREPATFAQRLATHRASIDLCSPSPPAKKLRRASTDGDDSGEVVFDHAGNV